MVISTCASASPALRMHAVSWLSISGSGPWLYSGIQPSAIAQCVRPMDMSTRYEFREAAARRVLIEEREVIAVEPFKELVPFDALERAGAAVARIVDAQHAGIAAAAGAFDARRIAAARLDPALDGVVVGGGLRGAFLRR